MPLSGRRVVVTGGAGFIGRHVVRQLLNAGARVTVPLHEGDRVTVAGAEGRPLTVEGLTLVDADLRESSGAEQALAGADYVVHLAARSGGVQLQHSPSADLFEANVAMTRQVLSAAAACGVRRCYLASSAVIYASDAGPVLDEAAHTVEPWRETVTPYAWSKLTDEATATWWQEAGLDVVVGRFTNVFGAGATFDPARSTVVHALVKKAVDAAPGGVVEVWGDGSAVRSFIHVRDAASGVLTVLTRGRAGTPYNISSDEPVTIRSLAEAVRDAVDPSLRLEFNPSRPAGPARRVLDTSRLASLGFRPRVSLEDGVCDVVASYRATRGE